MHPSWGWPNLSGQLLKFFFQKLWPENLRKWCLWIISSERKMSHITDQNLQAFQLQIQQVLMIDFEVYPSGWIIMNIPSEVRLFRCPCHGPWTVCTSRSVVLDKSPYLFPALQKYNKFTLKIIYIGQYWFYFCTELSGQRQWISGHLCHVLVRPDKIWTPDTVVRTCTLLGERS